MATTKKKKTNPYADQSIKDLEKELNKLELEYQKILAKGKLGSMDTPTYRTKRAQLLTALNSKN